MILVGVFTVVCSLTSRACFLEGGFCRCGGRGSLSIYDFLCENFGGYRRQGGNPSLEIVAATRRSVKTISIVSGVHTASHCAYDPAEAHYF